MFSPIVEQVPLELLRPALEAARSALRRLDDDDVPARLRKVASYQGGRLPSPLAKSLLTAIDEDEWLREKAVEELAETDGSAPDPQGSAALFVLRPPGWEFALGQRVAHFRIEAAGEREADLSHQLELARKREREAKRRWRDARREIARLEQESQDSLETARSQLRELRERDRLEDAAHAEAVAALEAARDQAEATRLQQQEAIADLRTRLRKVDQQRVAAERQIGAAPTEWAGGDAIGLARHLDTLVRTVEADPALLEFTKPPSERQWKLPPGARPDDRNAIDWLMRQPRPFVLLVDGYNVTFRLSRASDAPARTRLNEELSRFKLQTKTPVAVTVVYDSTVTPEVETEPGPGGVRVRFTTAGLSADEEIRRLASETDEPVVVISSDREVREGTEASGAIALWSEALIGWIQAR